MQALDPHRWGGAPQDERITLQISPYRLLHDANFCTCRRIEEPSKSVDAKPCCTSSFQIWRFRLGKQGCTMYKRRSNANFAQKAVQLRKYCRPVSQTWETPNMEHAVHYDTSHTTDSVHSFEFKVCNSLEDASQHHIITSSVQGVYARYQHLWTAHTFHLSNNLNSSQLPPTVTIESATCLKLQWQQLEWGKWGQFVRW